MNLEEKKFMYVLPIAILYGDINGALFIAKIKEKDEKPKLFLFFPPNYNFGNAQQIDEVILQSAIQKHDYTPVDYNIIVSNSEYNNFIKELSVKNNELLQKMFNNLDETKK